MKGSLLWKLMYVFCALAGILAGYGIFSLLDADNHKPNTNTKDNTLIRNTGDGVFFDGNTREDPELTATSTPTPMPTLYPTLLPTASPPAVSQPVQPPMADNKPMPTPTMASAPTPVLSPTSVPTPRPTAFVTPTSKITPVPEPTILREPEVGHAHETPVTETITYPAKIFGQIPVINRSDGYVSYFEFAYDLIALLEPEVKARGLNMNALLTKFALKALFCGVDIEKLDINAPIPRRLAALCLWLGAQVLDEGGTGTSAKSAQRYVTDIGGCSLAERKSVAYLYEQGIIQGYQISGQNFYPNEGLSTETGNAWLSKINQRWK